ncbi:MAG: hypothetical protein EA001_10885 [Oscillatoriales cyanobacterium]|nr:MAG: hypothetical protein EA001_10885 [Oscillatoriales cyanobacterium]
MIYHGAMVALADRPDGRLRTFYRSLLGEPARSLGAGYVEFHLVGGLRLGVFQPQPDQADRFQVVASEAIGPMGLCLEVADLDAATTQAIACGATVRSAIRVVSHGRELDAIDPVGNWLILYEPVSRP